MIEGAASGGNRDGSMAGVGAAVGADRLAEAAGSGEDADVPGHVFPAKGPRPTESRGEVTLHKLLTEKLPEGWYAWHSVRLSVGASEWIGEGDYVIACPDRGIVVLEVKSGQMRLEDGIWHQNGIALKKPPIAQATAFAHHLVEEIARAGGGRVPFGAACAFPDMGWTDAPYSGDLRGAVLGRFDLERLDDALPALVERIVRKGPVPMFARWRKIVHDLWGERWVACVRLPDQVGEAERRLVELDREQFATIEGWAETPRAFITGRAGTGKTIVALAIALRWARAGKRVLYLCFTDPLALGVQAQLAAARAEGLSIEAAPVRKYAEALLKRVGIDVPVAEGQTHWDEVSLHAAADALPTGDVRPDFVVVDEAQDFADSDWTLVDALATGRGLWVFGDDQQRFWGDRKMPDALAATLPARNRLRVQHRQTPTLAQLAARYAGAASAGGAGEEDRNAAEEGDDEVEPVRVVACEKEQIEMRVEKEVDKLLKKGAKPRDIAILSLAGQTHARTFKMTTVAGHPVARADQKGAGGMIVADTCLRFKGLERAFVVIVDLPGDAGKAMTQADVRMHIALTRATVGVVIVGSKGAVGEDRLAGW